MGKIIEHVKKLDENFFFVCLGAESIRFSDPQIFRVLSLAVSF